MLTRFSTTFQKSGRVPDFFWVRLADPGSPLFSEICGIVQKTVGLVEPLRATLAPLAANIVVARLGRGVNPTVYTRGQLAKRRQEDAAFIKRVLAQPKVWLLGSKDVLTA